MSAPPHVRVAVVCPSFTATPLLRQNPLFVHVRAVARSLTPQTKDTLPPLLQPETVAAAICAALDDPSIGGEAVVRATVERGVEIVRSRVVAERKLSAL
jgi:NAD(P)-dependent dehydrogenase (short-subunit alcohol dehydrogenase family)